MKFLFLGCSHAWGAELQDQERTRISALVSEHFGAEEVNYSRPGSSNNEIIFKMMHLDISEFDAVFMQWSAAIRDWSIFSDGIDSGTRPLNNHRYLDINTPITPHDFRRVPWWGGAPYYHELPNYEDKDRYPNGVTTLEEMKQFATALNIINSVPKMHYRFLQDFYMVEQYCKAAGVPIVHYDGFGMLSKNIRSLSSNSVKIKNGMVDGVEYPVDDYRLYQYYQDSENWLLKETGLAKECARLGFDIGPGGHVLEEGNRWWADRLINFYKNFI